MNDSHLLSCQKLFQDVAQQALNICQSHAGDAPEIQDKARQFKQNMDQRLADLQPKIMIYGIYNAGKSTLLNALIGEEKAEMNDIPTTKKICPYSWHEYVIYDTPGINAPEKDEEISKQQLQISDVIIFVMDSEGTFTLGKNYRELKDIVESGKKLLVVINNKSDRDFYDTDNRQEWAKIRQEVYQNFAQLYLDASPEETSKRFKIIFVNAQDALMARTSPEISDELRHTVLAQSNLPELEEAIIDLYKKTTGYNIIKQLSLELYQFIEQIKQLFKAKQTNATAQKTTESLDSFLNLQNSICEAMEAWITDQKFSLEGELYAALSQCTTSEEASQAINQINDSYRAEITQEMTNQLKRNADRFNTLVEDFNHVAKTQMPDVQVSPENLPTKLAPLCPANDATDFKAEDNGNFQEAAYAGLKSGAASMAAMQGLNLARFLPAVLLKSTFMTTMATVALPLLVGLLAFKFVGSSRDQEEQQAWERANAREEAERRLNEARQQRVLEMRETSRNIAGNLNRAYVRFIRQSLDELFNQSTQNMKCLMQQTQQKEQELFRDIQTLDSLKDILNDRLLDIDL